MRCLSCSSNLKNISGKDGNQPSGGLCFSTEGHFGSAFFDPMDGSLLVINICDECLNKGASEGKVKTWSRTTGLVRMPKPRSHSHDGTAR